MIIAPKHERGFTLIELMIVIAIIAILAAILIPNFLHARSEAQTAACEGNEKQIATALEEYAVDSNGSYAFGNVTNTLLGTTYLGVTPKDPVSGSTYTVASGTGGSVGLYSISDAGGHDTTTTKALGSHAEIIYYQASGLSSK